MKATGSKVPKIHDAGDLAGQRWAHVASRRSAAVAFALLSALLLQGCGTSEPRGMPEADASQREGQTVVARQPARDGRHSFDDRYPGDTFADRYAALQSSPAPSARPARQAAAAPGLSRDVVFAPPSVREATFGRQTGQGAAVARPATIDAGSAYRVAALSPAMPDAPSPVKQAHTYLIGFDNSAFPYSGKNPRTGATGGRYGDNRVLVHVPAGFDARKPGVIVVFFHGHGATLERDVRNRQMLPKQITESGVNAVLVAPQLAYDAADSSAGKFWERDGFKRFMAEAADRLAQVYGDPRAVDAFATMPVIVVAYSGGFETAAWSLQIGGLGKRVAGVVLLDAIYGHHEKFVSWIARNRHAFFISAYTQHNKARDDELARMLRTRGIAVRTELEGPLKPGTVALIATGEGINHRDYVTRAWTEHPVRDILWRVAQR
jgi:hypothetical protein